MDSGSLRACGPRREAGLTLNGMGNTAAGIGLTGAMAVHARGIVEGLGLAGLDCVVLDDDGKVAILSPGFRTLAGSEIMLRNGVLCSEDPDVQVSLLLAARHARGLSHTGLPQSFVVRRSNGRRPLLVRAASLSSTQHGSRAAHGIVLIFGDLDGDGRLKARDLKALFPLSEAEAEVAILLARGLSVADIAGVRRVTRETVRGQLKNVFRKLDVNRQADLVRIVDRLSRSTGA